MLRTWVGAAALLARVTGATSAACFDGASGFTRGAWRYCQALGGDMFMYYSPVEDDGNLKLGLHAAAHAGGWSALAFGGNGGMKGASQIVVRQVRGTWVAEDRNSLDYMTPHMDETQAVALLFASEHGGGTSWGVLLKMNACDGEHYPIEDKMVWMHWALGNGHEFTYHGTRRGQFHANLLRKPHVEPQQSALYKVDIRMPNVSITPGPGAQDLKNSWFCALFDLSMVMPDHNLSSKHHAVKFSPYLDPRSEQYVHHMILFSCNDRRAKRFGYRHGQVITNCQMMPRGCYRMRWPWARGSMDVVFPDNVGMPMGGGRRWLALQMHYYHPNLDHGAVDSSGVAMSLSPSLRAQDAAVLELNGGTRPGMRPPLQAGLKNLVLPEFAIPPSCTGRWREPLNILGAVHHAHLTGKYLTIEVYRGGRNLGIMRQERRFDFSHQSLEAPSIPQLKPGDEIVMTCAYDTSSRTEDVAFGESTRKEMCYGLLLYYPAQRVNRFTYEEPSKRLGGVRHSCRCGRRSERFVHRSLPLPACQARGRLNGSASTVEPEPAMSRSDTGASTGYVHAMLWVLFVTTAVEATV